jgi:hypothetical protein
MSSPLREHSAPFKVSHSHIFRAGSCVMFMRLCSLMKLDSLVRYAGEEAA